MKNKLKRLFKLRRNKLESTEPSYLDRRGSDLPVSKKLANFYRKKVLYRFFWGRSRLYRNFIHTSILLFTALVFLTGFSGRIFAPNSSTGTLSASSITAGNVDLLEQGGSVQSIQENTRPGGFNLIEHRVKAGEDYGAIAEKYGITAESLKLSNLDKIDYYASAKEGTVLRVPEINGILIKISEGETLETIMGRLTAGNRLDIIEVNKLRGPDYSLAKDSIILVPDGAIKPPASPIPSANYLGFASSRVPIPGPGQAIFAGIPFIDPLYACPGYGYSRGFSSWHNGIDLTGRYGCAISAAAPGVVTKAGWSAGGEGFAVHINHGNGVETLYWHGNGNMYVRVGDSVSAGQLVMEMGCTGYCTGTHLHLSMRYNGYFIDSAPYIPFWRP